LHGDYRSEHLFVLRQAHTAYGFVHQQLRDCDREFERLLTAIDKQIDASQTPPPARTKPQQPTRKNQHHFTGDARTLQYECFGTDVTELTGIETTNGLELYTEVGADMSPWATDQHFTSWLGLESQCAIKWGQDEKQSDQKGDELSGSHLSAGGEIRLQK
jgi:hypothetical protein